jgi:hypothetical protein
VRVLSGGLFAQLAFCSCLLGWVQTIRTIGGYQNKFNVLGERTVKRIVDSNCLVVMGAESEPREDRRKCR